MGALRGGRWGNGLTWALGALLVSLPVLTASCGAPSSAIAEGCPNAAFRAGPSARLPDCRAYEQVSPAETGGLDAVTLRPLFPAQAATCDGGACALVYMNDAAAFAGAPGNELPNAYLAERGATGWHTTALTPPAQPPANGTATVGYAFSSDLSEAVLRVPFAQLTPQAPAGVYNLYLRDAQGSYSLVTAVPPPPPHAGCSGCFQLEDVPAFAGASSDFSHVIFETNDVLVAGAAERAENLYEAASEHVSLVGILPDGKASPSGANAGGGIAVTTSHAGQLSRAVSQDGSRVVFAAAADGGTPDPQQAGTKQVYERIGGVTTVEASAPAPGAQPSECQTPGGLCRAEEARFWTAAADGSVVYFTSKASLTKESFTGSESASEENPGNDLYRYELSNGSLTDLTADAGNPGDPNGADVLGVIGSSSDGSYVYFVATGKLASGAVSGQPNLYVWHRPAAGPDQLRLIATLAPPEAEEEENIEHERAGPTFPNHSDIGDWASRPTESQAYLTPDGRQLAFMSVKRLTGYDNEDEATGEPDHEVFQYSAESGALACASCDPSGARPVGSAFIGAGLDERMSTPFHQPRVLSDDGSRLFFSSPDPLLPGLAAGSVKVFEFTGGAIAPISGNGTTGGDDVFLDASASGDDVFFASREQLLRESSEQLATVYDARVGGGFPEPQTSPPSCQASDCPAFSAPVLSTPVSATFVGPEDAPHHASTHTRSWLLAHALARCAKKHRRPRRRACIRAAQRRYGHIDAPRHRAGRRTHRRRR